MVTMNEYDQIQASKLISLLVRISNPNGAKTHQRINATLRCNNRLSRSLLVANSLLRRFFLASQIICIGGAHHVNFD